MKKLSYFVLLSSCIFINENSYAHSVAGNRIFPATLAIEDPAVADELTLPMVSRFKSRGEDGEPDSWTTATSAEFSKTITENFGISVGGTYLGIDNTSNEKAISGWDNFELAAKYQIYKNAEHEALISLGADWDIGNSGAAKVGAEDFSVITPTVFFGKGMGDLPDSLEYLKPIAVTGVVGLGIPTQKILVDPTTLDRSRNPEVVEWGFSLQYSLPYLQQHVKDVGISAPLSQVIPVVEFAMETPTGGEDSGKTIGTVNPGVIWEGEKMQLAAEAMFPVNSESGDGVGFMFQVHYALDDIFPTTLGKPL